MNIKNQDFYHFNFPHNYYLIAYLTTYCRFIQVDLPTSYFSIIHQNNSTQVLIVIWTYPATLQILGTPL